MGIWLQYQFFVLIKYPLSREMNKNTIALILQALEHIHQQGGVSTTYTLGVL